jgi:hypothetical protein
MHPVAACLDADRVELLEALELGRGALALAPGLGHHAAEVLLR